MRFSTHNHTKHSPCAITTPGQLVDMAEERLSAPNSPGTIVVCDHDVVNGAIRAREIAENRNLIVELGIECTTEFGEIGSKFLMEKECETFMRSRNTQGKFHFAELKRLIDIIRHDGTSLMLVDLHHPFDFVNPKRGFNFKGLIEAGIFKDINELMAWFDFTEVNGASMSIKETMATLQLALQYQIPIVSSEDAHFPDQIGKYYTETEHDDAREAIVDNDRAVAC